VKRRALVAGGAALALVAALVAGRYSRPAEVREVVKVQTRTVFQVERVEVAKRVEGPVRIVERRVEVPGPAGPTVTVIRTEDRGPVVVTHDVNVNAAGTDEASASSSKVTTSARPGYRASLAADPLHISLDASSFRFGVERRIVGPLWLGASYQHRDALLVSVAGEF
jgi:hypothetical protein